MNKTTIKSQAESIDALDINGWSGRIEHIDQCEYNFLNRDGCFTDTPQVVQMRVRLLAVELETKVGHISQAMLDELAESLLKQDTVVELETKYSEDAADLCGTPSYVVYLEAFTYSLEGLEVREGVFIREAGFNWDTVRSVEPALV